MSGIILKNICKSYNNKENIIENFNLEIEENEFIIFVGPSGCGKSTVLRMISGLENITDGELWINNEFSNYIESKDRNLAMVFQNYALYPHMTVYENIAFSLEIRKVSKKEIKEKVKKVAEILEITHLLNQTPDRLSGGQKQRVAIGSAIVRNPSILLMDEPLSNLDAKLREQMRIELAKLHEKFKSTIVYVTHDQIEAMTLADRIVVMNKGAIQQVDKPLIVYNYPKNIFVAEFIGNLPINLIEVEVIERENNIFLKFDDCFTKLDREIGEKLVKKGYKNKKIIIGVRPEDFYLFRNKNNINLEELEKLFEIKISVKEILGNCTDLHFYKNDKKYIVRLSENMDYKVGDELYLSINTKKINFFDIETEENILTN